MKSLLLIFLFLSFPISLKAGPLSNILKHSLRGGIKESIKNNQNTNNNSAFIEKPRFKKPRPNIFGKYASRTEAAAACSYWKQNNMHLASKSPESTQEIYKYKCKTERDSQIILGIYNSEVIQRYKY